MKKILLLLLVLLAMPQTVRLFGQELCFEDPFVDQRNNYYVEIFGGANFLQSFKRGRVTTDFETGYIVSGSVGYRWCDTLRFEAEYAYRRNSLRKIHFFSRGFNLHGHCQSSSYMANLFWDLSLWNLGCHFWGIQPFIGGGIGYACQQLHAKRQGIDYRIKKNRFAWQVMTGINYPLLCNTDVSIEYKFHQGGFRHLYSHSVGVGLKYNFSLGGLLTQ